MLRDGSYFGALIMIVQKPLVSFLIFSYNHSAFIEDAIRGAFDQTYSPLEIVISDDASTDDTQYKIQALIDKYQGNHQVRFLKNKSNLGLANHINHVLPLCSGEWIVVAAGDDVSEPHRTELIIGVALSDPHLQLIQSYMSVIDQNSNTIGFDTLNDLSDVENNINKLFCWGWAERISGKSPATHGATCAYSKKLLKRFEIPLDKKAVYEDNVFNWRAELSNGSALIREPLVKYRRHDAQTTNFHSHDLRVIQRKRRVALDSNVTTTEHNINDLQVAVACGLVCQADALLIESWLLNRKKFFELSRDSFIKPWPYRLYFLLRAISIRPLQMRLTLREAIEVCLPSAVANVIITIRNRIS